VLDDFSRYIVAWKLCTTMKAEDVTATLELALQASGLDQTELADRPRLLSDNGSSYIAGDLANWLGARNIKHLRGAPYHPMTQGKIERWHQTLKNRILLENYFLPGDLETQIAAFVDDYNHRRYHESIDNVELPCRRQIAACHQRIPAIDQRGSLNRLKRRAARRSKGHRRSDRQSGGWPNGRNSPRDCRPNLR
jgi:putative transposase